LAFSVAASAALACRVRHKQAAIRSVTAGFIV
jgi:hypothetical protein